MNVLIDMRNTQSLNPGQSIPIITTIIKYKFTMRFLDFTLSQSRVKKGIKGMNPCYTPLFSRFLIIFVSPSDEWKGYLVLYTFGKNKILGHSPSPIPILSLQVKSGSRLNKP